MTSFSSWFLGSESEILQREIKVPKRPSRNNPFRKRKALFNFKTREVRMIYREYERIKIQEKLSSSFGFHKQTCQQSNTSGFLVPVEDVVFASDHSGK